MISVKVETINFKFAAQALGKLTGRDFKDVLRNEAKSILITSLHDTGAASSKLISARYKYKGNGSAANGAVIPYATVEGKRVRVRSVFKKKRGGKKNNPYFKKLKKVLDRMMAEAKAHRGQSKATWLEIATQLGIKLVPPPARTVPGYVRKAFSRMPSSLKALLRGSEHGTEDFYIQIKHAGTAALAPKSNKGPNGFFAFKDAVEGRRKHFKKSLEKGTFKKLSRILRAYPGLKVKP